MQASNDKKIIVAPLIGIGKDNEKANKKTDALYSLSTKMIFLFDRFIIKTLLLSIYKQP